MMRIALLAAPCLLCGAAAAGDHAAASLRVMPWITSPSHMDSVTKFAHKLSGVSFPHFSLSSAGGLINSTDRIDVGAAAQALGLETYPMVVTTDIVALRTLFASPERFNKAAVAHVVRSNSTGLNIDCEGQRDTSRTCGPVSLRDLLLRCRCSRAVPVEGSRPEVQALGRRRLRQVAQGPRRGAGEGGEAAQLRRRGLG